MSEPLRTAVPLGILAVSFVCAVVVHPAFAVPAILAAVVLGTKEQDK